MSRFNGDNLKIEIFGSSHAPFIGVNMYNFPKKSFDQKALQNFLNRRKPTYSPIFTSRVEDDLIVFNAGVRGNQIVDNLVTATIENKNQAKKDYDNLYGKPRPNHADYSAYLKDGRLDFAGGGEFSGRMTAPLCIAGGIALQILNSKGIIIKGYVNQIGNQVGMSYDDLADQGKLVSMPYDGEFPALKNSQKMIEEILSARLNGDSVGGSIECVAINVPGGVGDNLFGGLESKISALLFSIPGAKSVEFGFGANFVKANGSKVNDSLHIDGDKIYTQTNNCGGILGGVTNGMPITLRVGFKPTPSISTLQNTVDLVTQENVQIQISGRHDACFVPRAVPAVEACLAIALLDSLVGVI